MRKMINLSYDCLVLVLVLFCFVLFVLCHAYLSIISVSMEIFGMFGSDFQ